MLLRFLFDFSLVGMGVFFIILDPIIQGISAAEGHSWSWEGSAAAAAAAAVETGGEASA